MGGELPPIRMVGDPYPASAGISLDPANNRVAMGDENLPECSNFDRAGGEINPGYTPLRRSLVDTVGYIVGIMLFDRRIAKFTR
jgi:hypothetical protein